jgi:sec-independent protein translocase protein TatA
MLGLDNPIHILFLLVAVLLVFGAKRLPEMGKSLGDGLRSFKESVSGESPAPDVSFLQSAPEPVADTIAAPVTDAVPVTAVAVTDAAPVAEPVAMRPAA